MTINEQIYKQIAKEEGLLVPQVEEIVKSQFYFLVEHMEQRDWTPVRMQYMGLWQCKPKRLEKLREKGVI